MPKGLVDDVIFTEEGGCVGERTAGSEEGVGGNHGVKAVKHVGVEGEPDTK